MTLLILVHPKEHNIDTQLCLDRKRHMKRKKHQSNVRTNKRRSYAVLASESAAPRAFHDAACFAVIVEDDNQSFMGK